LSDRFLWRHLERWQQKQVYFFSTHFFTALQGSKETATTTATAALALTSTTTAFDTTTPIESSSIQQQQEEQPHRFSRVFRWTQKVDLFEKKFLFVPINDRYSSITVVNIYLS
jgi:Ulp1 family protease